VSPGSRLALVGATGALGSEVLSVLDASALEVAELLPIGSARSEGESVSFRGDVQAVRSEAQLRGIDLAIVCAPPAASLDWVREALRAQVPCIDAAGALALSSEVPLALAAQTPADALRELPLVSSPAGAALALGLVLAPIQRAAGLARVDAMVLESAAGAGRVGLEALGAESVALFNQQDLPEPVVDGRPLAFDCHPAVGDVQEDGSTASEARLAATLARMLGGEPAICVGGARIPVFVGQAIALRVETREAFDPKQAREALSAAPWVALWDKDAEGPNLRAAAGSSDVIVGRLRADATRERSLLAWLAADPLRLAAANAVALAERRLGV
jgi:aspartate-semialdehyde dehydrogenase